VACVTPLAAPFSRESTLGKARSINFEKVNASPFPLREIVW